MASPLTNEALLPIDYSQKRDRYFRDLNSESGELLRRFVVRKLSSRQTFCVRNLWTTFEAMGEAYKKSVTVCSRVGSGLGAVSSGFLAITSLAAATIVTFGAALVAAGLLTVVIGVGTAAGAVLGGALGLVLGVPASLVAAVIHHISVIRKEKVFKDLISHFRDRIEGGFDLHYNDFKELKKVFSREDLREVYDEWIACRSSEIHPLERRKIRRYLEIE
ncbi:MAG: hypothetical protein CMO81_10450 [Waddliaceae bacterium]|nr:hypothetical protein [Waddliaceae bacterium]